MQFLSRLSRSALFMRDFAPLLANLAKAAAPKPVDYSDFLASHFESYAQRPVLISGSGSLTWAELDAYANRVAHWAAGEGLQRGDVVALLMENRPEFVAIWLGLSRIGVVTALLNTNLTGDRLAHCMREADTQHFIVGQELVEAARSACVELEAPPRIFLVGDGPEKPVDLAAFEGGAIGASSLDQLLATLPTSAVPAERRAGRRAGDGLFLIYTSGTTGLPKAARISHSRALGAGMASWKLQKLSQNDRVYCCLPLYHSAGGLMAAGGALLSGGSLVIARRFSAKRFWSDCATHGVTSFQYIGELCRYMLNSPEHPDERSHKVRVVFGNGLRPEVWTPFQERFAIPRIVEFYGATEGNMPLFNLLGRVGAVGYLPRILRRVLGIEIVRFDIEQEEVVRGADGWCLSSDVDEPGEMLIKISKLARFEGYTNDAASSKKVLTDAFKKGDAYFRTGDLLRKDADGFYFFVDRIGDTFRWKGENVATSEVAEVISIVPGIEEANVYGVEIPGTDGRAGMAALVTKPEFELEELDRVVESELAAYARPIFIRILPELEITGTFKHRKVDLVKDGFDPALTEDPLYFRDPEKRSYVPLDPVAFDRIQRGEIRL